MCQLPAWTGGTGPHRAYRFAIALTDEQWELVADVFDRPGRRGAPAQIPRREMVEAMLFLARTGCQWRYLPERYGPWTAVWAQWRRWRANGVWARAMARLAAVVRLLHDREPIPSMVMVDAQTVKGGRYGPTFHEALLVRARTASRDPAWRADYRATRPKVERKIAHLMRRRHGGRRARVRGRLKVGADFALLAASVNLARLAVLGLVSSGATWAVRPT